MTVIGRYQLEGILAVGGMARVDIGRVHGEAGFTKVVAVKRLLEQNSNSASFRAMLYDEARVASCIRHPNVVALLDVIKLDDEVALVLEYVLGGSLREVLGSERAQQPVAIAARIVVDVLEGLHGAHAATDPATGTPLGIVHRDVSPKNILIDEHGVSKITDFGIAKARDRQNESQTLSGEFKGTVAYAAPEQLINSTIDARADVYASAVVLWELIAGGRLFHGDNNQLVMGRVLEGVIPPLDTRRPDVPPELVKVVARGVAKKPTDRFETAREMAMAIEAATPLATTREVAAWVERSLGTTLEKRRAQAREIAAAGSARGLHASAPPSSSRRTGPPSHAAKGGGRHGTLTDDRQQAAAMAARSVEPTAPTELLGESIVVEYPHETASALAVEPKRSSSRVVFAAASMALASAIILAAIVFFAFGRSPSSAKPAEPAASSLGISDTAAAASQQIPPPSASSAALEPTPPVSASPSASQVVAAKPKPKTAPPPPAPRAPDCATSPTYVDHDGIRRIRRECRDKVTN